MKPTLYLETTIPSYLVAKPSRDIIALAHQEVTRDWWDTRRIAFEIYVSPVVLEESSLGDPQQANLRLRLLESYPVLEATARVEELAARFLTDLHFPQRAIRDAAHLAFATAYSLDYLLTWNCAHIANAFVQRRLSRLCENTGIRAPTICTPEELLQSEEI